MPEQVGPVVLFGIPNCDRVRAARKWLEVAGVAYRFHDLRKDGLSKPTLAHWFSQHAWDEVINTRGSTWRLTPENDRASNVSSATQAALAEPTLIRRPVLEFANKVFFGFSEPVYAELFPAPHRDPHL